MTSFVFSPPFSLFVFASDVVFFPPPFFLLHARASRFLLGVLLFLHGLLPMCGRLLCLAGEHAEPSQGLPGAHALPGGHVFHRYAGATLCSFHRRKQPLQARDLGLKASGTSSAGVFFSRRACACPHPTPHSRRVQHRRVAFLHPGLLRACPCTKLLRIKNVQVGRTSSWWRSEREATCPTRSRAGSAWRSGPRSGDTSSEPSGGCVRPCRYHGVGRIRVGRLRPAWCCEPDDAHQGVGATVNPNSTLDAGTLQNLQS